MDINFTAGLNFSGYGIVATNLLKSLVENGNDVVFWSIPPVKDIQAHKSNHDLIRNCLSKQNSYNPNAPSVRHWHQFDLAQHVGKGPRIGSTVFELDRFTERELHHLKSQDGICVPTKWGQRILEDNGINLPICILPHGVDREIFHEQVHPALPELKERNCTVFINCGKWEVRKGHDVLVDAFNKSFEPSDNVHLIMSCYNPFMTEVENKEWADLYLNSKMGVASKVTVINGRLETQQDVAALMATADVGIFLSRAEGWGLESCEILSMGRQVILTNYAGHTEYATHDNSLLIDCPDREMAYDGKWFDGKIGQWTAINDEQIDQAVSYMRQVHVQKQHGKLQNNLAGIETAKAFSWSAAANKLVKFISDRK